MAIRLTLLIVLAAAFLVGCGSPAPIADTPEGSKQMPPGWKSKDVQIHIDK